MSDYHGRFVVLALPNIAQVFYRRDVSYGIERIDLESSLRQSRRQGSKSCYRITAMTVLSRPIAEMADCLLVT